jgi:hypothetical protein
VWSPWALNRETVKEELEPIPYRKGSQLHGRVFEIKQWGQWGLPRRLDFLTKLCEDWQRDPQIAQAAARILQDAGVQPRDSEGSWRALLTWVQKNIHYQNEQNERIQSPAYSLEKGYGDCDDMAVLLKCLGGSLRLPSEFTVSGREKGGQRAKRRWVRRRGPIPPHVEWSHIYLCVGWPPFKPSRWVFAEPTLHVPLGWDVMSASDPRAAIPEMAGVSLGMMPVSLGAASAEPPDPLVERRSMLCECGPAPRSEAELPSPFRAPGLFLKQMPWGQIIVAAVPTVLAALLIQQLGRAARPLRSNPRR